VIHVLTAKLAQHTRRFKMKTFTIDAENNISVFASPEEAAAASTTPFDTFTSQQELTELTKAWPAERLVATWNSLPGVVALKNLPDRKAAKDLWAKRIWTRIQGMGDDVQPEPEAAKPEAAPAKPKAARKPKAGAQSAKAAPARRPPLPRPRPRARKPPRNPRRRLRGSPRSPAPRRLPAPGPRARKSSRC
jgi:hypothetical protein